MDLTNQMPIATKSSKIDITLEKDTKSISQKISNYLSKGDIVFFYGEIGVGKTTFIKHLINYLQSNLNKKIMHIKPKSFNDYIQLQLNARLVLSDSGTINEESSILNFPAINIRDTHERPEAMEEASVMMVGVHKENIFRGIEEVVSQQIGNQRDFNLVSDYSSPNVSSKVIFALVETLDRTVGW